MRILIDSIGAYRSAKTPLHRYDPRLKIALLCVCVMGSFIAHAPFGIFGMGVLLAGMLVMSKASPLKAVYSLKPMVVVLAFSLIANTVVLFGTSDVHFGILGLSGTGALRGFWAVMRISLALGFVLVFSATTSPVQITEALAFFLRPFAAVGLDVDALGLMTSIALRFIPLTLEEVDRIRTAQRIRAGVCEKETRIEKVRSWFSVLVPVVVSLFRRSEELARTLSDRGFGTHAKTSLLVRPSGYMWAAAGIVTIFVLVCMMV